jgi:hypothetical protein
LGAAVETGDLAESRDLDRTRPANFRNMPFLGVLPAVGASGRAGLWGATTTFSVEVTCGALLVPVSSLVSDVVLGAVFLRRSGGACSGCMAGWPYCKPVNGSIGKGGGGGGGVGRCPIEIADDSSLPRTRMPSSSGTQGASAT